MIKRIIIAFLHHLRLLVLGPTAACRYYIGCTEYAMLQVKDLPLHKALYNIGKRLLSCNPFW